ncbi:serine hydroxymethyltransferase [candidate division TM6 bacterium RIFCSPHIGHO2_12_FULL_36_22]|nr:MAG: serine hydroxymethyltransferase [candidate division TM6 bacterium RIFCSPHIGHO2_12_FULL_36_22]
MSALKQADPSVSTLIDQEQERLEKTINLIASENYCPLAVRQAVGSIMTNKYAEGYPGKRYYAGCQFVDDVENLARDRCKALFKAEHANVQSHSGSQANAAVYFAALEPGDTVVAMSLKSGGHLTHGHPINFSGTFYNMVHYEVDPDTQEIDYDAVQALVTEQEPKLIIAGASAYSRSINFAEFRKIADSVGALLMVDMAHIAGLVATGLHASPVPYADFVTSTTHKTLRGPRGGFILCKKDWAAKIDKAVMPGLQGGPFMNVIAGKAVTFHLAMQSEFVEYQKQIIRNTQALADQFINLGYKLVANQTENHLFMLDLRSKNITGKDAEETLASIDIYVNRNTIPFDPQSPFVTSGIRLGTPMLTSRHMKKDEMILIASWIDQALMHREDKNVLTEFKTKVNQLCSQFPFD